jgi:hypothetical protein
MPVKRLIALLLLSSAAHAQQPCSSESAFGIAFGSKPPKGSIARAVPDVMPELIKGLPRDLPDPTAVPNNTAPPMSGDSPELSAGRALKLRAYGGDPDAMVDFALHLDEFAPPPNAKDKALLKSWRSVGTSYGADFWIRAAALRGHTGARKYLCEEARGPDMSPLRRDELISLCELNE